MKDVQNLQGFSLPEGFRGASRLKVQLWWLVQATLFRLSPQVAYGWRRFLLRLFGAKVGKKVLIRASARITYPWKLSIGDYSWVGDGVELYTLGPISIGLNCVISQRSYLCAASHDYSARHFDIHAEAISLKDHSWVAMDVFIAPGVTIGSGAVIGARSSVFQDMPEGMICYGYPARPVKARE